MVVFFVSKFPNFYICASHQTTCQDCVLPGSASVAETVLQLSDRFVGGGFFVTMDRYFGVMWIMIALQKAGTAAVGTIQTNRRCNFSNLLDQFAACKAISQVLCSRIVMGTPGLLFTPIFVAWLRRNATARRSLALDLSICCLCNAAMLSLMVPTGLAIFPQTCVMSGEDLRRWEPAKHKSVGEKWGAVPSVMYFNKGL